MAELFDSLRLIASPASIYVVTVPDRGSCISRTTGEHVIPHPFPGYVLAQVFTCDGSIIPLPGSGRAWWQFPDTATGEFNMDRLYEGYYPLRVVIVGCVSIPES